MPNLLSLPFKKTDNISVKHPVRAYLQDHTEVHPDAFKQDISRWDTLRKNATDNKVHVDRIVATLVYHAQLVSVLNKFPADIGLEFSYSPAYSAALTAVTLSNIVFERASVLYNLAALYSQLAESEDRNSQEGIKRASSYYMSAAGTLSYLISNCLPQLLASYSPEDEDIPHDLTEPFLKSLEGLMLAQAQECVWQRAGQDNYKDSLLARIASGVAILYQSSLDAVNNAPPQVKRVFPSAWLQHAEVKKCHFDAVTQYRKGRDDLGANRYGHEIARLRQAKLDSTKGYQLARSSKVTAAVMNDIESLLQQVEQEILRAERDNDLVYHKDVPTVPSLPAITSAIIAEAKVPTDLSDLKAVMGDKPLFGEMLCWGAQEAIRIYNNNKKNFIEDEIVKYSQQLDDRSKSKLRSLNLPHSLEAFNQPVRLPPSLLKQAEQVRQEEGPARIENWLEDVQKLAARDAELLNQAMDILDAEADEDEAARQEDRVNRPPSFEVNQELVEKNQRYREILKKAAESDEMVREKWDEWAENITELTWDEDELEAVVPSSTLAGPAQSNPSNKETREISRALTGLLENLEDSSRARAEKVKMAQVEAERDDIRPQILKTVAGFEQWADVQPAMFQDVFEEEMGKYHKFVAEVEECGSIEDKLLATIEDKNSEFLKSRKDDPSVKEREYALQSLSLAYHKYTEISHNLTEGLKFYNELGEVLGQFVESCKTWSRNRKQEIQPLSRQMASMSVSEPTREDSEPVSPPPKPRKSLNLPPPSLDSDEWHEVVLPPGPAASPSKRRQPRKSGN